MEFVRKGGVENLKIVNKQKRELEEIYKKAKDSRLVRRSHIILLYADGKNIKDEPRSGRHKEFDREVEQKIIQLFLKKAPFGQWSLKKLKEEVLKNELVNDGISEFTIRNILEEMDTHAGS